MNKARRIYIIVSVIFFISIIVLVTIPTTQSLAAAYANLAVAIGTIGLASVTFSASRDARRSIAAQEVSAERMKDALRPLLDIGVLFESKPSSNGEGMFVRMRNVGVGPATIRLFTGRNDLGTDCFYKPVPQWRSGGTTADDNHKTLMPIIDMVLGPSEETVAGLGENPASFTVSEGDWVSSLSVFYEDVYGRYFRTRIVYLRNKDSARVIGKESFDLSKRPVSPWKQRDIVEYYKLEVTPYPVEHPNDCPTTPLHFIKYVDEIKKSLIDGDEFTCNESIRIIDVTFDRFNGGFPTWKIQIGTHRAFKLKRTHQGAGNPATFSVDPSLPFRELGLNPSGQPEKDIQSLGYLYDHILGELT